MLERPFGSGAVDRAELRPGLPVGRDLHAVGRAVQDDGLDGEEGADLVADDLRRIRGVLGGPEPRREAGEGRVLARAAHRERGGRPRSRRQLPGQDRDDDQQDRREHVRWAVDDEGVDGRQKEEVVGDAGGERGDQPGAKAVEARADDHRHEIEKVDRPPADPSLGDIGERRQRQDRTDRDRFAGEGPAGHEIAPGPRPPLLGQGHHVDGDATRSVDQVLDDRPPEQGEPGGVSRTADHQLRRPQSRGTGPGSLPGPTSRAPIAASPRARRRATVCGQAASCRRRRAGSCVGVST